MKKNALDSQRLQALFPETPPAFTAFVERNLKDREAGKETPVMKKKLSLGLVLALGLSLLMAAVAASGAGLNGVAALIGAAIRHQQPQPWMYEATCLAMQAAGRPKEEIERTAMSAVDFAQSTSDLLYIGAYLMELGYPDRALGDGGQHLLGLDGRAHHVQHPQPGQPGHGEDYGIDRP